MTRNSAADLRTALAHHQAGRLDRAEPLYRALLAADASHADTLHLLGVLRLQRDDPVEAAALIERAVRRNAGVAYYHGNLAEAYLRLGRPADAVAASRQEATLAPSDEARHRLGRCLNAAGAAAHKAGDFDAAEGLYEQALKLAPTLAETSSNLGSLRQRAGDDAAAIAHYRQALALAPDLAPTLLNLGTALGRMGRFAEAGEALARYATLMPENRRAALMLGEALEASGDRTGALAAYRRATDDDAWRAEALFRVGRVLRDSGRLDEAEEAFRAALEADPAFDGARIALFSILNWLCAWDRREALLASLPACVERIAAGGDAVDSLFPLAVEFPYVPADPALHRRVLDAIAAGLDRGETAHGRVVSAPDRLRLGYVSPDFGDHPISQVCRRLFALHDRARFEVTCYALDDRDAGSPLRTEIEASADRFVSLAGASDGDAVRRIVEDGIHVLVDLTGYLRRSRPRLFAARAAPVQVYWLGHAGELRAPCIPYLIADRIVLPPAEEDGVEAAVVRLPETYHIADRMEIGAGRPTRAEMALPEDAFVFCAFNNPLKIDREVFSVWMKILAEAPQAVLWLSHGISDATTSNLEAAAKAAGIDPARMIFAGWVRDKSAHLARHRCADLFLDTFRFNASSTTLDALWAGLPVLTRRGDSFYGRISASMLTAVGMPDLICETTAAYVERAVALAGDPEAVAALRRRLDEQRLTAPLFDTPRFVRHLEAAYEGMWRQVAAGEAPKSFDVAAAAPPPP